ncbi:DUF1735 domain-containing protein [Pedobacter sp. KLB.chiD]|uniref:DUF1735 domain-containing protein n=1 Tax=Pedobacter sp. KLB.chiD TaxID=3387402 RepID=UPI00399BA05C
MKIFKLLITGAILTTVMSSCLKNKFDTINPSGSPSVVEFKNPVPPSSETPEGSLYTVFPVAYEVGASVEATYTVQLTGPDPAPQDVSVNIGVKSAAVAELNADKSVISSYVPYVELPASLYTITTPTVTIPSGQRTATVKVTYKTANFDFSKKYALPISITSSNYAGVSKNFGTVLLNVSAKNAYDGVYTYTTSANTSLVPNANKTVSLITVNATTVSLSPGLLGTYTNEVTYTVDPSTNKVTVACPSLGVQTPQDTRSNWNPATKVMTVFWKQGNGGRTFEETFTYKGVR